jgi:hypothetical protein
LVASLATCIQRSGLSQSGRGQRFCRGVAKSFPLLLTDLFPIDILQ